jgi:hypothetical protein
MMGHMVWKTQRFINVQITTEEFTVHVCVCVCVYIYIYIYIYIYTQIYTHTYILPGSRMKLDKINVVPRYLIVSFGVLDLLNG